jgi:hypothetical protein
LRVKRRSRYRGPSLGLSGGLPLALQRQARSTLQRDEQVTGKVDAVRIALGLRSMMPESTGLRIETQHFYCDLEPTLAVAQHAGNQRRTRVLHVKTANRRRDFLRQLASSLHDGSVFCRNTLSFTTTRTT